MAPDNKDLPLGRFCLVFATLKLHIGRAVNFSYDKCSIWRSWHEFPFTALVYGCSLRSQFSALLCPLLVFFFVFQQIGWMVVLLKLTTVLDVAQ